MGTLVNGNMDEFSLSDGSHFDPGEEPTRRGGALRRRGSPVFHEFDPAQWRPVAPGACFFFFLGAGGGLVAPFFKLNPKECPASEKTTSSFGWLKEGNKEQPRSPPDALVVSGQSLENSP